MEPFGSHVIKVTFHIRDSVFDVTALYEYAHACFVMQCEFSGAFDSNVECLFCIGSIAFARYCAKLSVIARSVNDTRKNNNCTFNNELGEITVKLILNFFG